MATFPFTANFLANARGFIIADSASVTWAFNQNTNTLTATAAGGGGGPSGANPAALIGLTAVNGSAGTFLRSDGAPALDQSITPTWTGLQTFSAGLTISGGSFTLSGYQLTLSANASVGGTNTGDQVLPAGANPTGTIGLTAVNGAASTFMRSDGAPALSQAISPTWTGTHVFTPPSGVPVAINASSSTNPAQAISCSNDGAHDIEIAVASSTAGDAYYRAATLGVINWSFGNRRSDGALVFSPTVGLGSAKGLTIASATGVISVLAPSGTNTAMVFPAGTTTATPLKLTAGTNNTAAIAGAHEYDGTSYYITNETTAGRGLVPVEQIFHLAADGGGITTIANFFGATSNIPLVSGGYYEIEITLYYVMGATGSVVTWTLTNSAAPTSMDLYYEMCPATGLVAPPGTATMLEGQILGGTTAAQTVVTGALTGGTKQYAKFRIMLKNGTGTSLKIQATETTTTTSLTPKIGSYWKCTRIPAGNVGTFAA